MENENFLSVEITVIGDHCDLRWIGSDFRGIQTEDRKLKKQLMKDVLKLIKKYEDKGCHIAR